MDWAPDADSSSAAWLGEGSYGMLRLRRMLYYGDISAMTPSRGVVEAAVKLRGGGKGKEGPRP